MKSHIIIQPTTLSKTASKQHPQAFDRDHCFICGKSLTSKQNDTDETVSKSTKEHIFPKWMLKNAGIFNTNITYYNGQLNKYNRITIPSCKQCNGIDYSQIESKIRTTFTVGYDSVIKLPEEILFIWLCKIHYGLRFYEATQKYYDKESNETKARITKEAIEELYFEHLYLQIPSNRAEFEEGATLPGSIHIYKCLKSEEYPELNFDYCEIQESRTISLRYNDVGIIAFLDDFGFTKRTTPDFLKINNNHKLHPTQFRELYARSVLFSESITHTGKLLLSKTKARLTITPLLMGSILHNQHIDLQRLATLLQQLWQCDIEDIYNKKEHTITSTLIQNDHPSIHYENILTLIPPRQNPNTYLWPFHNQHHLLEDR